MTNARVPYKVVSAYESFLEEFRKAVQGANGRVLPDFVPLKSCFASSPEYDKVVFELHLYLKGCPCSGLPGKRRLDVEIRALETLKRSSWSLTRSTVYLSYLVVFKSKLRPIRLLHFDFEEEGQTRHPFFHVQLMDDLISHDLRRFGLDLRVKPLQQSNQRWIPSRIPTPDMTFASVLYCLAADHLENGEFAQFANRVKEIQNRLPMLRFNVLKKSLDASKDFKSSHWYAHSKD